MPSSWELSLGSLLESSDDEDSGATPLGVELTLVEDPRRLRAPMLLAKVVRPGRSGWVNGGLGWSKLGSLLYHGDFRVAHIRLLQEMHAVYRSRQPGSYYADDKVIDLSNFDSRRLWGMLEEAGEIGLDFVHSAKRHGPVGATSAKLCLDVVKGESLVILPALTVDGTPDPMPVKFVGADCLVFVSSVEFEQHGELSECRIGLARLGKAAPEQLRKMLLEEEAFAIPTHEIRRFSERYYPKLRHMADVISSDGSFTPPQISEPTLVLNASYGDGHELEVTWEWVYQVGMARKRAPLDAEPEAYRDLTQEKEILASLDVDLADVRLRGIETMRFTTEVLPLIEDQPGVEVEISGEPVDYREAGDSLRIGISATDIPGQTDWFDLGVSITVEGRTVPFMEVFLALTKDQPHLLLPDGAYFSLRKPELRTLHKLIIEARALLDQTSDSLKISRFQAGLWDELAALGVVEHQARAWKRQVQGLLEIEAIPETALPARLDAELRPYQLTGFRWLAFLWQSKLGGILADDMGLGKTLQTLALMAHVKEVDPASPPFLVVAPTSVVPNWVAEANRFVPGLEFEVTSYALLRINFEKYAQRKWAGLVLDEAQVVKNHQSKIYQCVRRLPTEFKLAITGTPMENNLMELWSLLSITAPGLFPNPQRFHEYYARPIQRTGNPELVGRLRRRVKPLVKRRTKDQVAADLPAKQEQILEVELHPRHRKVYQTHLQRERLKVLGMVEDMNKNRFTIFRSLTMLRQLSLHAALVDEQHKDVPCAKADALLDQLGDVVDGGHRALVFSQFTSFLQIVRDRLDAAGVEYCYLDGSTTNRAKVLQRFKEGAAPVFLISLKAGGFGLNLTEADYCFLLDPWWNPATEAQAVDRTHRIGQSRNVMVYRLIAKGTIEEKVMALKAKKAELFASVLDDGNMFGSALDAEDIRGLFT